MAWRQGRKKGCGDLPRVSKPSPHLAKQFSAFHLCEKRRFRRNAHVRGQRQAFGGSRLLRLRAGGRYIEQHWRCNLSSSKMQAPFRTIYTPALRSQVLPRRLSSKSTSSIRLIAMVHNVPKVIRLPMRLAENIQLTLYPPPSSRTPPSSFRNATSTASSSTPLLPRPLKCMTPLRERR
jgi:hypothetical protein